MNDKPERPHPDMPTRQEFVDEMRAALDAYGRARNADIARYAAARREVVVPSD